MKILVDIPDSALKELKQISERRKLSRAAVIREAIAAYLQTHRRAKKDEAFGLWGDRKIDGLEYQNKLRDEW